MTLANATLFPQALLPLYIFEPRYRQMLSDALRTHRMFTVAMQKPGRVRETPCTIAGLGLIRVAVKHNDGTSHLILQGLSRVELREPKQYKPYRVHAIQALEAAVNDNACVAALVARVHDLVKQRISSASAPMPFPFLPNCKPAKGPKAKQSGTITVKEVLAYLDNLADANQVADLVCCALVPGSAERQTILETVDVESRLKHLIHFLMAEIHRNRKDERHE